MRARRGLLSILVAVSLATGGCAVGGAKASRPDGYVGHAAARYPDIDFTTIAPARVTYQEDYDVVWETVVALLRENGEGFRLNAPETGALRTAQREYVTVDWAGPVPEDLDLRYEYNILIFRQDPQVTVAVRSPFWNEDPYAEIPRKDIPDGANMIRHIFFFGLGQRLTATATVLPAAKDAGKRFTQ